MTESRLALIIASSQYEDQEFSQLTSPAHDAEDLAQVLKDPNIGDFKVKTLINETKNKVEEEIEGFFTENKREDLLLLYISCHGIKDKDGHLYFATSNTKFKRLKSTAISDHLLNNIMHSSHSQKKVLLLDCCYSGAFARGLTVKADNNVDIKERFKGKGLVILTSSNSMQYSFEGDEIKGESIGSIFTSTIVNGLKTGEADTDKDGYIFIDELYGYIHKHISKKTQLQDPQKFCINVQGNILIAKNQNFHKSNNDNSPFGAYKIGVVVPVYNEERLIQETVNGIPAYVEKIYIINDRSADRTAEIINSMTDPRVVPIHHEVNKGAGASIINGYKHALYDEMDLVAVMFCDNQMDPYQLPKLIMPIIEGKADYTKGNRLISKKMLEGRSPWRTFWIRILSVIFKISSSWDIVDPQNRYTVISKYALETIDLDSIYTYYGYANDILIKLNAYGMRVIDVTIPICYGSEKLGTNNYGRYVRRVAPIILKGFLWRLKMKSAVLDFRPVILLYTTGTVLFPLGILFDLLIVLQKMVFHGQVYPYYLLLAAFISLEGLQLFIFAIILDLQMSKISYLKTT
ncbi:caspase, EACC1-associated type [Methanosarcina sp.]|uniref:caspase, EACC1-associated type n=1 Tax=Methanosarcina sp. TaxID=2213 RepID=UPI002988B786|nr:glycosyltransferase [Methanosarcina sp.]MDW5552287.1 glycosyltransferase [Methanosarcina sp.]